MSRLSEICCPNFASFHARPGEWLRLFTKKSVTLSAEKN